MINVDRAALENMAKGDQARVKPGFDGFFFALTESEISAADQLGARHRVALFNNLTN